MKKEQAVIILLSFWIISSFTYSQELNPDTIKTKPHSLIPIQNILFSLEEFDFYRELNYMKMNITASNDSNTIWLWTSFALSKSGLTTSQYGEAPSNVSHILYQQYLENSKFNPVRYVFGMAQTAAVGYLAYKHLKKYGFRK